MVDINNALGHLWKLILGTMKNINVGVRCISYKKKMDFWLGNTMGTYRPVLHMCKAIFFYFLVYGSSDPNFSILEKK